MDYDNMLARLIVDSSLRDGPCRLLCWLWLECNGIAATITVGMKKCAACLGWDERTVRTNLHRLKRAGRIRLVETEQKSGVRRRGVWKVQVYPPFPHAPAEHRDPQIRFAFDRKPQGSDRFAQNDPQNDPPNAPADRFAQNDPRVVLISPRDARARADSDSTLTKTKRSLKDVLKELLDTIFDGRPVKLDAADQEFVISVLLVAKGKAWNQWPATAAEKTRKAANYASHTDRPVVNRLGYFRSVLGGDLCEELQVAETKRQGKALLKSLLDETRDQTKAIMRTANEAKGTADEPATGPV